MSYLKDNFLLENKTAEKLYFDYAKDMPIFDYHCHLPEKQILENATFNDVFEIWLKGDHYKWRLMRNYGIDEEFITGDKSNKEKFFCYCKVLGTAFGNPLYHWSQVELKEFFNCEIEINEGNAETIWNWCNDYIKLNNITPQSLIEKSNVTHIFTTNEIFDDLSTFEKIAKKDYKFKVIPAFRADKIMNLEADGYTDTIAKLSALVGEVKDLNDLEKALENRLNAFIKVGTTASDIALQSVYEVADREDAEKVFAKAVKGEKITAKEAETFKGYFTYFLMKLYAKYDIRTELHVGAMRNNNTQMLKKLGLDTGYDSIAEDNSIKLMSRLFDKLNDENALPRTIIFNLNPKMNTEIMTLVGCFQDSSAKGKIQYGPAWWFLDNKVGMENHLKDMTATGHIATFVGMLTDSRSLLSYPRHHYFRRILCNYLGTLVENGEITQDIELIGSVVKDVAYNNSIKYFDMK
ncbi:MAG: glucuronate isomerase [Clostridiales bacterium]|nr:glucuronate isomerase [Clostridiales bacterium]